MNAESRENRKLKHLFSDKWKFCDCSHNIILTFETYAAAHPGMLNKQIPRIAFDFCEFVVKTFS